jgi:hypothetical protein
VSLTDGHAKMQSSFPRYYLLTGWNKTSRGASRLAAGKTCGVGILPRFIRFVEGGGFVFSCTKSKEDVLLNTENAGMRGRTLLAPHVGPSYFSQLSDMFIAYASYSYTKWCLVFLTQGAGIA